ncbi:MAG: DUF1579 family protein [Phycisphaerales bacterium]|nr:DUF1579 family protein [Phycisphaerales bacterium]
MLAPNDLRNAGLQARGTIVTPITAIAIATIAFGAGSWVTRSADSTQDVARAVPVQEEMDPEAMMEMYAQAGQPDEHHEALKVFVGTWDADLKTMMPDMEEFNTTGTATYEMMFGDRFIKLDFRSSVMGDPMRGMNLTGYHKARQRYESIWIDDKNTALNYLIGQKTEDGWVYEGEETDPVAGMTLPVRDLIVMDGDDKFTFTRHYPAEAAAAMNMPVEDGQDWVPGFQIVYTRAKADAEEKPEPRVGFGPTRFEFSF